MFGLSFLQILIRLTGLLGIACTVIGYQCKKHKAVIGFRTGNELFFAFQYLLLGGYTGAILNGVGIVRNLIFIELVKRDKNTYFWRFCFSIVFVLSAILTWSGFPSLVFCTGKITTTFVYGSKNMTLVRILTIVTSFMWIVYNLSINAYEAIVSDSLTILSAAIGIVRFDIFGRKKDSLNDEHKCNKQNKESEVK